MDAIQTYNDGMTEPSFTLNEAQSLYRKFAGAVSEDAARAMFDIARHGEHQQVGWGRLRLLSLRELGRFLIRNGRGPIITWGRWRRRSGR
jgi:ribosomal protein S28E/S33